MIYHCTKAEDKIGIIENKKKKHFFVISISEPNYIQNSGNDCDIIFTMRNYYIRKSRNLVCANCIKCCTNALRRADIHGVSLRIPRASCPKLSRVFCYLPKITGLQETQRRQKRSATLQPSSIPQPRSPPTTLFRPLYGLITPGFAVLARQEGRKRRTPRLQARGGGRERDRITPLSVLTAKTRNWRTM